MCILERWSFHQVDHWKRYVCASAFQSGPHTIVQRWPIRGEKRKWNKHTFSVRSSNECLLAMICLLAMMIFRVAVLCMSFGSLKTQIVFEKKFSSRAFFKQRFLRINKSVFAARWLVYGVSRNWFAWDFFFLLFTPSMIDVMSLLSATALERLIIFFNFRSLAGFNDVVFKVYFRSRFYKNSSHDTSEGWTRSLMMILSLSHLI